MDVARGGDARARPFFERAMEKGVEKLVAFQRIFTFIHRFGAVRERVRATMAKGAATSTRRFRRAGTPREAHEPLSRSAAAGRWRCA